MSVPDLERVMMGLRWLAVSCRLSGMYTYGVDLFFVSFERALLLVYRFSLPDCLLSSS
jgi:hypothetical protein